MHGFLNIDKSAGPTSHDVVAQIRRLTRQRRVGHAGTLDPAATGVLVVALGQATRLIEYVQEQTSKRYLATVHFGQTTTTDDAEGEILETRPVPELSLPELDRQLAAFRHTIRQKPPAYSAIHVAGQRAYDLARAGVTLDLPEREVTIEQLTVLDWQTPLLTLDIVCSKGTYIRSLARDIGAQLGSGAHLASLRRTAVGTFTLANAITLTRLTDSAQPELVTDWLLPPENAVGDWPHIELEPDLERAVRYGQLVQLPAIAGERVRAHGADGSLVALLVRHEEFWKPTKVFTWS
jgi:tRNA pseudouridine55 synthase